MPEERAADILEMFSIDGESGWITTTQEADCEAAGVYRFSVVATDHGSSVKLSSSVLVEVRVTDQNDNPPTFSDDLYRGSVVENSSPGEVIVSMTTADADVSLENRLVTCYITGETAAGFELYCRLLENTNEMFHLKMTEKSHRHSPVKLWDLSRH